MARLSATFCLPLPITPPLHELHGVVLASERRIRIPFQLLLPTQELSSIGHFGKIPLRVAPVLEKALEVATAFFPIDPIAQPYTLYPIPYSTLLFRWPHTKLLMERCGAISNANFSAKSVGRMRVVGFRRR